jgi:hypothetical protein
MMGFYLKIKRLCGPNYSMYELLVREAYDSELMR